jgi:hypothetical protein
MSLMSRIPCEILNPAKEVDWFCMNEISVAELLHLSTIQTSLPGEKHRFSFHHKVFSAGQAVARLPTDRAGDQTKSRQGQFLYF